LIGSSSPALSGSGVRPRTSSPPRRSLWRSIACTRGKNLRRQPFYVRRNVIEDVLDDQDVLLPARRLADDGLKAWEEVLARGLEGLVAKDPQSPYVGGRTLKWLKVKQPKYREGERGREPKGKSSSAPPPRWCKVDPLAAPSLLHAARRRPATDRRAFLGSLAGGLLAAPPRRRGATGGQGPLE
jgi:hypothetical protein